MIIAITGGTGFIGRHLIARHCARGDRVRYLTRTPPKEGIASATAFVGDLTNTSTDLRAFARGADVLYHCAAELRAETDMTETNVKGTINLISAAGGEVGRWVQLSSTGIYGRQSSDHVFEDSAINPANAYERTKAASDSLLCDAVAKQKLSCVLVRPSNVYGADMPNQSLFKLIEMIRRGLFFFIGPQGAIANYVHVENVVDALELCATKVLQSNARTYIVSDHRTMEDLVAIISSALGKSTPRLRLPEALVRATCTLGRVLPGFPLSQSKVDALTNRTVFHPDRIMAELGYTNKITLEAGMNELVSHWKTRSVHA